MSDQEDIFEGLDDILHLSPPVSPVNPFRIMIYEEGYDVTKLPELPNRPPNDGHPLLQVEQVYKLARKHVRDYDLRHYLKLTGDFLEFLRVKAKDNRMVMLHTPAGAYVVRITFDIDRPHNQEVRVLWRRAEPRVNLSDQFHVGQLVGFWFCISQAQHDCHIFMQTLPV